MLGLLFPENPSLYIINWATLDKYKGLDLVGEAENFKTFIFFVRNTFKLFDINICDP